MTPNTYDIGDVVRLTASFTDLAGAAATPSSVTVTVKAPDGTTSSPSVTSPVAGTYQADYAVPAQAGLYHYRWAGTGGAQAAEEGKFRVRPSGVL